ncbi:MAG: LacI family DNA-binding transcriptional regulator [Prevotellaceae bacterium]|jgi:LacI family transcriptional regulator|nr:LacI family DNA-binding transcriptional regulator [Prevotellaceae bacterium]
MENKSYTIKDIARMAGVSAGTVDRVLHHRGDVSLSSYAKVQEVLDAIDYHPNMFAIGLAAKRAYRIACVIPAYVAADYWSSVAQGVRRAAEELQPFNVTVDFFPYTYALEASYADVCDRLSEEAVDAALIAPNFTEPTRRLATRLDDRRIPYLFVDFNMEHTHPLCYIGQDSRQSGYLAAKLLMQSYEPGEELVIFQHNQKENPAEIQMQRRLEGFMHYLGEHFDHLTLHHVLLNKEDASSNHVLLDAFFGAHPRALLGAVFNSRIYQVAGYLREAGRKMHALLGYDLLEENVKYLRSGEIDRLIGQRPGLQGYCGVKALSDHVVFKRAVTPVKYMPIDILLPENIDFYFEFE